VLGRINVIVYCLPSLVGGGDCGEDGYGLGPQELPRAGQPSIVAMLHTVAIAILIKAPGTVLRLSGLFNADDGRDNSKSDSASLVRLLNLLFSENPIVHNLFARRSPAAWLLISGSPRVAQYALNASEAMALRSTRPQKRSSQRAGLSDSH